MSIDYTEADIVGRECRHAVYCPPRRPGDDDLHVIKEILHLKDGRTIPRLRQQVNFKREFFIVKEGKRNYKQHKEWIKKDHCDRFVSTQSQLVRNIARALGTPWLANDRGTTLKRLCRNPYIFGADILSTALIKRQYMLKYPDLTTPHKVAVYDIETNMLDGSGDIMMGTVSCRETVFTAIRRDYFGDRVGVLEKLQALAEKYLGNIIKERNIKWEFKIVETSGEVAKACILKTHEIQPDFLAIWNIDFDLPRTVKAMEKEGMDVAAIFSDPSVPPEFRFYEYVEGQRQKKTSSGKLSPRKWNEQWHVALHPAGWYLIDAACAYTIIRTGSQAEPSMALDDILDKVFEDRPEIRKLNFVEADGYSKGDWHQFMQEMYPLEYVIYNGFDCISVEMADEKTTDLRLTLPMFSGWSDYRNFSSQPRRLSDGMDQHVLENDHVMGCTSDQMKDELDELTTDLGGWITMLPAHLVLDNGIKCIQENPLQATNIRTFVADLDVAGSYPNGGAALNISKETTKRELCGFIGIDDHDRRMQGINLSGGHTNAVEVCQVLMKAPSLELLLKNFIADKGL